jgi:hypothetical protein
MADAKRLGDTRFILVSAEAVCPTGVYPGSGSRHCISLHVVLAEGRYKQGGRGGGAPKSLRCDGGKVPISRMFPEFFRNVSDTKMWISKFRFEIECLIKL